MEAAPPLTRPPAPHAAAPAVPALLDLRGEGNHPLALRYAEVWPFALLQGRLADARTQPGLDVTRDTPFVIAGRRAVAHGLWRDDAHGVVAATLADYYRRVRPGSAADWLGLGDGAHPALRRAPPWGAVPPWRARTLDSYRTAYEDAALVENRACGRERGIADGWQFCGPVSEEKIAIEAGRILGLLRGIEREGYRRSDATDGDVRATALVDERGDWRWLITAGNHRAAALAALGRTEVPVRINLVISRADVAHWRHVREALYTPAQALAVFDRIFEGRPEGAVLDWLQAATPTPSSLQ